MRWAYPTVVLLILAISARAKAITISIDYSFDVSPSFFDTPSKKEALEAAAQFFEETLVDQLDAIIPEGNRSWSANLADTNSTDPKQVSGLIVPADTLIIYAGARDLPDDSLGRAIQGLALIDGGLDWANAVQTRGERNAKGVCATDFAPWGGSLAFDTKDSSGAARQWHFDVDSNPAPDQYDLFSVALHEIGHLLGIGDGTFSWKNSVNTNDNDKSFTGPASMAAFGDQPVPLEGTRHWAARTTSQVYPDGEPQMAAMASDLPAGTRHLFTHLDVAALDDIGWDIAPLGPADTQPTMEPEDSVPRVLRAGDADQDYKFDQLDVVRVLTAATYLTGEPATWGEGDWDGAPGGCARHPPRGDGKFNQLDIVSALRNALYLKGPYASLQRGGQVDDGQTSLMYNAATGELSVDAPAGSELSSINIDSAAGIFTAAPAKNQGGSFDNDSDSNIFKASFGSSFGSLSFGNVAQTGLDESFVVNDLTVFGSLADGGDLGDVDLVYIPEPSTVVLVTLGLFLLIGCTRWSEESYWQ